MEEIKRLKAEIKLIDNNSNLENYKAITIIYEKYIETLCRKLRGTLLSEHNLFISNPVYLVNYSYALNILSSKNTWIEALRLYNKIKYLMPLKEMNYDMLRKIVIVCDSLLIDKFFDTRD